MGIKLRRKTYVAWRQAHSNAEIHHHSDNIATIIMAYSTGTALSKLLSIEANCMYAGHSFYIKIKILQI